MAVGERYVLNLSRIVAGRGGAGDSPRLERVGLEGTEPVYAERLVRVFARRCCVSSSTDGPAICSAAGGGRDANDSSRSVASGDEGTRDGENADWVMKSDAEGCSTKRERIR